MSDEHTAAISRLWLLAGVVAVEVVASALSAVTTVAYFGFQLGEPPTRLLVQMGVLPILTAYATGISLVTALFPSAGLTMIVHDWTPVVPVAVVVSYIVAFASVSRVMSHFEVNPL